MLCEDACLFFRAFKSYLLGLGALAALCPIGHLPPALYPIGRIFLSRESSDEAFARQTFRSHGPADLAGRVWFEGWTAALLCQSLPA